MSENEHAENFADLQARLTGRRKIGAKTVGHDEPGTQCQPEQRVCIVERCTVPGGHSVHLLVEGPRRGLHANVALCTHDARLLAAHLLAVAREVEQEEALSHEWDALAAWDVPEFAAAGISPAAADPKEGP
jgi:hypothetical protein